MTTSHTSHTSQATPADAAGFDSLATAGAAAADSIDQAFAKAGESLARSLAKAAETGKLSFADLARSVLDAADRLAGVGSSSPTAAGAALIQTIGQSLFGGGSGGGSGGILGGTLGGILGGGGDALSAGAAPAAASTVVNLTVQGASDPQAFLRSEAQIAQALTRAANFGGG